MPHPAAAPTSYEEISAVLSQLHVLVREARRQRQISVRLAARQIGISFSTVSRIEAGHDLALSVVMRVLAWLNTPVTPPPTTEETRDAH